MNNSLREQIRGNMNTKVTDELLDIWQLNNRVEWSDEAFDVILDILKERGVEIPEQDEPVYQVNEENLMDDGLDVWDARALDDENQPEFYDILEVITLKDNINLISKAIIVVYILVNLLNFQGYVSLIGSYFIGREEFTPFVYLVASIVIILNTIVSIAIVYLPLKALVQILRILMEMEFRSRKSGVKPVD